MRRDRTMIQIGDDWTQPILTLQSPEKEDGGDGIAGLVLIVTIPGEKAHWMRMSVGQAMQLRSAIDQYTRSGEVW